MPASKPSLFLRIRTAFLVSTCFANLALAGHCQAPHTPTPAEVQRVDALIRKMTLDEKLDYIGGTGFGLRAVPEFGHS